MRRPGESSTRKFRELRRERMRKEWRDVVGIGAIAVASGAWAIVGHGFTQLLAAMVFGAAIAFFAFAWALGFDAHSLRWVWGAAGEEWTAEELELLGPEWRVFHDLPNGRSNLDHVVVGPPGVFLVDSKNLSEPARVDESGLRAGRLRYGGAGARRAAVQLKEAIETASGRSVWVQSVLCVWGELEGGMAEHDRVLYVPGSALCETLSSYTPRMSLAEVERISAAVRVIAASGPRSAKAPAQD